MLRFFVAIAVGFIVAAFSSSTQAADFPPVSELKPQKELPDPLVMLSGQKVQTKEQWEKERRPELKALFQHYMYGYLPPKPDKVFEIGDSWSEGGLPDFMNGKVDISECAITTPELTRMKRQIHVLLILPHKRSGPVP